MDFGAGLADIAAHALWLQAGAMIAFGGRARRRRRPRPAPERRRARRGSPAENEGLRDELWRLKEAASARDRAEAASEAKSRFLTTMSHEIRTPISGILGMADLLREASLDPENASYVEAIRSSGSALIALIDEILDLAKIEAGRFDLVVETVDLRRLTEGVVELLAPRAQSKGIEIASSFSAAAPRFVRADGHASAPGPHQPRRQRGQIHRSGRRLRDGRARRTRRGAILGDRHRAWRAGGSANGIFEVSSRATARTRAASRARGSGWRSRASLSA